jgi:hypothetical protein
MGDKRIFRFLESYVNFSIRFKMGRLRSRSAQPLVPPSCPCDQLTEEVLAAERDAGDAGPRPGG